jgi:type II secretory pathway component GspD/PulD (secretin)
VTQVIALRYESAAQLVNVLRPLITPNNTIAAFPASNALVITDYADNLRRIDRIIASLDQAPGAEPILVPLRNASALDIVALLNRLLAEPGAAGAPVDVQQRVTVLAEPRSNSVLVRADNPGRLARVKQLIEQLDTPEPARRQHVHRLPQECRSGARRADAARDAERERTAGRRGRRPLPPRRRFSWGMRRWPAPFPRRASRLRWRRRSLRRRLRSR